MKYKIIFDGEEIDESFVVEDDMIVEATILYYLNINISVQGSGVAKVNKTYAFKGDTLKLIYTPDMGYKFSHIIYNGTKVMLSDDDTFLVTSNEDINIIAVFEFDELTMPIMSIELETPLNEVNQENYVNAKMSISNTDEQYEFSDLDFLFRGRGNWSWDKEKKGYRIKFNSKQNLFGNCESKHWAIIASYTDVTILRNKMSFGMVDVLDEIYYVTSCVNLEVFINGEYRGVYSLVELPRAEKDKMNIDENLAEYIRFFVKDKTSEERFLSIAKNKSVQNDKNLEDVLKESFLKIGIPEYTAEERAYAKQFNITKLKNFIQFCKCFGRK